MGFFLDGSGNGALAAVSLLRAAGATDDSGLGRSGGKVSTIDKKARGVAASFFLGREAESKTIETKRVVGPERTVEHILRFKDGGEVIARRRGSFPGGRNEPGSTISMCIPSTPIRGKREFVKVANGLLRAVKAGVKIGTSRGDGYATLMPDKKNAQARVYFPGAPGSDNNTPSCVTFKLTQAMKEAAAEELHYAGVAIRENLDPKQRKNIKAVRKMEVKEGRRFPIHRPRNSRSNASVAEGYHVTPGVPPSGPSSTSVSPLPTGASRESKISARAEQLWKNAGRPSGRDAEFYFKAEKELRADGVISGLGFFTRR